jgi:cyclopropane fatty-acyl-phospholipid synthase-like methyltransferase
MHRFWDERYAEEGVYGREPGPFWVEQLALCKGNRVLLPCEGEGRNAVWAAQHGWKVDAFDGSRVAVETCKRWASAAGVEVQAFHSDAFEFTGHADGYDVVGLFYAHMPPDLRADFHARAARWLKPGGTLILEGFNPQQINRDSGGPSNPEMLFSESMLRSDFSNLAIQHLATRLVELNEGPYHQGPAEIIRMVASRS